MILGEAPKWSFGSSSFPSWGVPSRVGSTEPTIDPVGSRQDPDQSCQDPARKYAPGLSEEHTSLPRIKVDPVGSRQDPAQSCQDPATKYAPGLSEKQTSLLCVEDDPVGSRDRSRRFYTKSCRKIDFATATLTLIYITK